MNFDYNNHPQIQQANVQYLWYADFWDFPRSGMALYEGRKFWFEVVEEAGDEQPDWFCRVGLFELSDEEIAEEEAWHRLFTEKVGEHTTFNSEGKVDIKKVKPQATWYEFYEPYRKRSEPNYLQNPVIGWFEILSS